MPDHVVKQGECLSRIAAHYGFRDFRTVYDDAGNAELRKKRPNPNLLYKGDVVFIPEKAQKQVGGATGKRHRFRVSAPRRVLRLVVEDLDGKKMAAEPYELEIEGRVITGVTGSGGLIETEIPHDAVSGLLMIRDYAWPLAIAHLNPFEPVDDEGVSGIQARLRNLGYHPGPIDGVLGPRTTEAIREFQADNPPLAVDGVAGPATRAMLVQLYGC